jgi:hypothetical protein
MELKMIHKHRLSFLPFVVLLVLSITSPASLAVTTKITRHNNSTDMLKGEAENVIISSRGTIQLGRSAETLLDKFTGFSDVWAINSIVVSGGTLYFGTSPNGGIYKYNLGTLTRIYPPQTDSAQVESSVLSSTSAEKPDANATGSVVDKKEYLKNEHIFVMTTDASGRLLAGISGDKVRLCRFESDKMETIFQNDESKYIFAIAVDNAGNIFLGTGPKGRVYRLDAAGANPQVIYESRDKNILSLAIGKDGYIYAGSDTRGVIYKIEPHGNKTTVLYDSEQPEIAALLFGPASKSPGVTDPNSAEPTIYAAATLAQVVQAQTQFASSAAEGLSSGRPETDADKKPSGTNSDGGQKLEIANTQEGTSAKTEPSSPPVRRTTRAATSSHLYQINKDGFVTDVFTENVVLLCMTLQDGSIYLGTGNTGQVFCIEPALERQSVIFEDKQATQITAITADQKDLYLGSANPAKIIKLTPGYSKEGIYISDLIDAEQPAQWGKLQLDADIPAGCKVFAASRSGNVKDVNDPTFSSWSELQEITQPVQLQCPLGRFCQYKLVLRSDNSSRTPLIREVAVASTIPNLAPKVNSVDVVRLDTASKQGVFKINYNATDENNDKMTYTIAFRKIGRTNWINLKDDLETATYEWDGKTIEDGRYEIRVTAGDFKSNSSLTGMTGSRVSNPVIVDNTAPVSEQPKIAAVTKDDKKSLVVNVAVRDELSVISKLEYTIDGNETWQATVPDDLVYDTMSETFTIAIDYEKYLPKGEHVLSMKITDAAGNTAYKTSEITAD